VKANENKEVSHAIFLPIAPGQYPDL